jgi:hypothetical protein
MRERQKAPGCGRYNGLLDAEILKKQIMVNHAEMLEI